MSTQLSPENEAFLAAAIARHDFPDRDAALDEAVALLRRRRELIEGVNLGVVQLNRGDAQRYEAHELERFLNDVETREKQRFAN